MNPERYAKARELFVAAREREAGERRGFVERACGADRELAEAVLGLLAHEAGAAHFLERPAVAADLAPESIVAHDELPRGALLGPFRILRKLGEGGFGIVYEAEQERPLRRRVALKVLRPGMNSRAVLARFGAESQALARMEHAGIAKVFDAGLSERGQPYFAMQLIDGEPLTSFCTRHALDLRERVELVRKVCVAVQHAHQKGLLHRDLKPSNVLVAGSRAEAQPVVIDFGVAKALGDERGALSLATEAGAWVGTPAYMAPEQAGADASDVDTRVDVYALGALTYELLTGVPPFEVDRLRRASLAEIARILRDEEPLRPSARAARESEPPFAPRELRGELDWIVLKALDKDRERRYASPSELAADLARYVAYEPVLAGPPSALYRAAKFARRQRVAVAGAALVLLALVAGLASTLWQARVAAGERDLALLAGQAAEAARTAALADQKQAEIKAESVLAVLEFVNRTLGAARPENSRQGEPTVREMLDDAVRVADASFEGRPPEVEGQVRLMLGGAYASLSRFDEARPQLERALERLREAEGAAGPEALRALNELAALDATQGLFDDAERRYRESIELCTRTLGESHMRTKTALLNQAQVQRQRGEFEAAVEVLERLCAADADDEGARRLQLFACQSLASTFAQMGEPARAVDGLARALEAQRELLGGDHPEVLDTASNYGSVLVAVGRVDEAEGVFAETLETQLRVLGGGHVATAATEVNLAGIRLHQSRFREAVELYEHALATRRVRLGEGHEDTRVARERLELARNQLAEHGAGAGTEQ